MSDGLTLKIRPVAPDAHIALLDGRIAQKKSDPDATIRMVNEQYAVDGNGCYEVNIWYEPGAERIRGDIEQFGFEVVE